MPLKKCAALTSSVLLFYTGFMTLFDSVHAQVNISEHYGPAQTPEFQSLGGMVSYFLPIVFLVAGIIFFILIVLAGFGMITSAGSGDAHAQERAKAYLTYAVIGLMIVFGSFWIVQIINYVTNGSLSAIVGP